MITLQNVTKTFNHTIAVDHLNLKVPKGSVFGLLGPNGAGKTTTIRMIMNIMQPDSGAILLKERLLLRSDFRNIGYLPEERGLYQKTKLRETIHYFARLKGMSAHAALLRTEGLLEQFDLLGYADRKIEELSKGNQQKVQFIIAIVHEPILVILDEPFSGLDPINQLKMKEVIHSLHEKNTTFIFSTHQMEQVEKLCSEICLINAGQSVLEGPLATIRRNYGAIVVEIEFQGDREKLAELPLRIIELSDQRLRAELNDSRQLNDILPQVIQRVTLTHFRLLEPSLEQIFIDRVKGSSKS